MTNHSNDIIVRDLYTQLGSAWVHQDLSFKIHKNSISAIVGGSGSGKSTLFKILLGLLKADSGYIELLGQPLSKMTQHDFQGFLKKCGVLFQNGALFSSLTVFENIAFPLRRFTKLNNADIKKRVFKKLEQVELEASTATKMPSELSGGMQKRAALARALVLEPELLFLDEPSSGLDPRSVVLQNQLLKSLNTHHDITIIMITHDVGTLASITDDIIFLGNGKIIAQGDYQTLKKNDNPDISYYFQTEYE